MASAAPQFDRYYSSNPSILANRASSGTYRAPTVPPLRSAAALGRQQTLGPVFSDEEDGDDTEYIATRMRELQMGQNQSNTAHINQLRFQQQAIQLQQQYLLQQLLAAQSQSGTRGQPGSQEASMAHLQQLHLQQMQMAHMRQQVDPRLQSQLVSQLQAQPQDIRAQAMAAQAQLQAQVYARAQKQKEEKARFEAKPNASPESPIKVSLEETPKPSAPLGRFAQARQTSSSPFGELTALLARRAEIQPVKAEDPAPAMSEDRLAARTALQTLGHGRPGSTAAQNRAKSNPFPMPSAPKAETTNRSVSLAQPLKPIRQPFGPPAPTNELGERNFQSMARKAAGKGLGMLGRRGEGGGGTSPVV